MYVWQLFLKEDIYQLLECKRERSRQLAALTLQRYTRMFFVRKRFVAFRKKIIALQAQCRGFLTRSATASFIHIYWFVDIHQVKYLFKMAYSV